MYYFVNDHLGTPQKIVDGTGSVVWAAAYLPFGKAQVKPAVIETNLRFPGQYFDAESGLHYNWHRYFDPDTGRYITADPIGLDGGINLYVYVMNNPLGWLDPSGLEKLSPEEVRELILNNNLSRQSDALILCLIYKESTFDTEALSQDPRSTAAGLMQMTETATDEMDFDYEDIFDPVTNIQAGSSYIDVRIGRAKGNVAKGLDGYGTGPGYSVKIFECEKCLKTCEDVQKCLDKVKPPKKAKKIRGKKTR